MDNNNINYNYFVESQSLHKLINIVSLCEAKYLLPNEQNLKCALVRQGQASSIKYIQLYFTT